MTYENLSCARSECNRDLTDGEVEFHYGTGDVYCFGQLGQYGSCLSNDVALGRVSVRVIAEVVPIERARKIRKDLGIIDDVILTAIINQ